MMILWDIDGTLLVTQRSGMAAMKAAGEELFRPDFTVEGVDYAGRLDPLIIDELLLLNGVAASSENVFAMRRSYRKHLESLLAVPGRTMRLPGVHELLRDLSTQEHLLQGLLTGNWEETGTLKLRSAGIDMDYFKVLIWGDDSPYLPPKREYLPQVAMERCSQLRGRVTDPATVTIIGDTPNDVHCAKVHGCRSLGVATGLFSVEDLYRAGADLAVHDLQDTDKIFHWLAAS